MRDRRTEKELREQLIRVEEQRNYWMKQYSWGIVDIQELTKDLEEQKQIAAKHISMYYDVVQKTKNCYGGN